jgi:hypothetical protein
MAYLRPTLTRSQLRRGERQVLYEVAMLSNTAALLNDDREWKEGWRWRDEALYTATFVSFLMHARSLMDFACPPRGWEKDPKNKRGLFASDYCSKRWKPERWPKLREQHEEISREIAHLTSDRPVDGTCWPYAELLENLTKNLLRLTDSADRMSEDIRNRLVAILADNNRVAHRGLEG